jgi:1,2-diacylglycerol 3-alpha-glucosyltransferase
MNILIISQFPPDYDTGVAVESISLANSLAAMGQEVAYLYCGDANRITIEKNNLVIFSIKTLNFASEFTPKTLSIITEFLDDFNPDIIHSNTEIFLSITVQLWAIRNKVPFVSTFHYLPSETGRFTLGEKGLQQLYKLFEFSGLGGQYLKNYVENCSAVICLTDKVYNFFDSKNYKVNLIRSNNGIDLQRFFKIEPKHLDPKQIILGFTGQMDKRKNQIFLLEALKELPPQYHLSLIGRAIDKRYQKKLTKFIEENALSERVTLTGAVKYEDIPAELAKLDIFVSASLLELQSLSIIEALASGIPVVALENETIELFSSIGVISILEQSATPAEFADEVLAITRSSDLEKLGKISRKAVINYDIKKISADTFKLYQSLLKDQESTKLSPIRKKFIKYIPNRKLKQYFKTKLAEKPFQKKINTRSIIFGGGAVAASLVIYAILKSLAKSDKKNNIINNKNDK